MSSVQKAVGAVTAFVAGNSRPGYQTVSTENERDDEDTHRTLIDHQSNPIRRNARRGLFTALLILSIVFFGSWIAS
jgi:hypothetical protein